MKIQIIENKLNNLDVDYKSLRNLASLFLEDLKNIDSFEFRVGKRETKKTIRSHLGFLKNGEIVKIFVENI